MTDEQAAELRELDAAIAANPGELQPLIDRRWFLAHTDCDWDFLVSATLDVLRFERPRRPYKRRNARAGLLFQARENWRKGRVAQVETMQRFYRSESVAAFILLLENAPDCARWRRAFPHGWDELAILEHAAKITFCVGNDWRDASADDLKAWALAIAIARDLFVAAEIHALHLDAANATKRAPIAAAGHARRACNSNDADYVRLAHWILAIEAEPDNARFHAGKGRFLRRRSQYKAAIRALRRAIELAPAEPSFHEARARAIIGLWEKTEWWSREAGAVAACARALQLRIERGEIAGDASYLAAQGARTQPDDGHRGNGDCARVRAIAFYSLAIEKSDNQDEVEVASWHLARALAGTLAALLSRSRVRRAGRGPSRSSARSGARSRFERSAPGDYALFAA